MHKDTPLAIELGTGDEDWAVVTSCLPAGWREQARITSALKRNRGVKSPDVLLRLLLIHLAEGCSLRETAIRARASGLAAVSDVAILKRLRASEQWLRWICSAMVSDDHALAFPKGCFGKDMRIRLVDATAVSEPGSSGSDWRLHYAMELKTLQCDFFELTDVKGGESYRRVPIRKGDLILGDRAYATREGVRHVTDNGGIVLARMTIGGLACRTEDDQPFPLMTKLKTLRVGQTGDWDAWVVTKDKVKIPGRICAIRRSRAAAALAERKVRRKCQRNSVEPGKKSLLAAKYVFVFTTLPRELADARTVLALYRARWQVELAFKRLKSILGFGHLPKYDPDSCRAWLHGKLLVAMIAERLVSMAKSFSPWGYDTSEAIGENAGLCG